MKFPWSHPGALQIPCGEVQERRPRHVAGDAGENRPDIYSIQSIRRQRTAGKTCDSRQQVQARGQHIDYSVEGSRTPDATARGARRDSAGEFCDERHTHTAFERVALAPPQSPRTALIPGAVVACEEYQRVLIQAVVRQSIQHLSHAPVQLLNYVGIEALSRLPIKGR